MTEAITSEPLVYWPEDVPTVDYEDMRSGLPRGIASLVFGLLEGSVVAPSSVTIVDGPLIRECTVTLDCGNAARELAAVQLLGEFWVGDYLPLGLVCHITGKRLRVTV